MKMIPGMNQYAGMLDEAKASDSMRHMKAIIQSMTLEERAHPRKDAWYNEEACSTWFWS